MANRTSLYDITQPGDRVLIEGTLVYSALRKPVKPNFPSQYDMDEKYRITIEDPKVVKGNNTDLGKHVLDEGITHGAFQSKKSGKLQWGFDSKSKFPIAIYTKNTGSDHVPADEFLENELATGQPVGILFSIYKGKRKDGGDYTSGSLDGVIIETDDPKKIKYLGGGTNYDDFLGAGTGKLEKEAEKNKSTDNNTVQDDDADDSDDLKVNDQAKNLFK